jgi:UPF0755 protein
MRDVKALKLLLILVVLAVGIGWWAVATPYGPSSEQFVDIAPGTSTPRMAEQLKSNGIIRSAVLFEALKEWKQGSLKAGVYRFDHPATLSEIYARLHRGDVYTRTLVIPEGYNIFDIAQAVQTAGLASRADFLKAETDQVGLVQQWSPNAQSLEGFLFPDTYRFSPHASPTDMLAVMTHRFGQMAAKLGVAPGDAERVVTMASLVEREVHLPAERAAVAGVFVNRLAAGMPLQTDPTVVYASLLAGTWTGVIHESELHSASPYNTYAHTGLPPGPICNPGVAAMQAALHPEHSDYLYFVAQANGATKFAATEAEHEANVAAYRASLGLAPKLSTAPLPASMQPSLPSSVQTAPKHRTPHVAPKKHTTHHHR